MSKGLTLGGPTIVEYRKLLAFVKRVSKAHPFPGNHRSNSGECKCIWCEADRLLKEIGEDDESNV